MKKFAKKIHNNEFLCTAYAEKQIYGRLPYWFSFLKFVNSSMGKNYFYSLLKTDSLYDFWQTLNLTPLSGPLTSYNSRC